MNKNTKISFVPFGDLAFNLYPGTGCIVNSQTVQMLYQMWISDEVYS
jgi:hypothetical protein